MRRDARGAHLLSDGAAGVRTATLGEAGFGRVWSLAVLLDGRLAAGYGGGGGPSVVRVWDVPRRAVDAVIRGHTSYVTALSTLVDGRLLSGSGDRTLKVWDERALSVRGGADTDACAATLVGHASFVLALSVLPDRRVASGGRDGTVCGSERPLRRRQRGSVGDR